jgi:hypothetical protein
MPVIELVSSCRVMEVIFLTDVRNMKTRFWTISYDPEDVFCLHVL